MLSGTPRISGGGGGGGGVTGSGSSGQVAYWNGATNITGDANLKWDGVHLGIGGDGAYPVDSNYPITTGGAIFGGIGLNDLISLSSYTGQTVAIYTIEITNTAYWNIKYGTLVGVFQVGEVVTDLTSGATGTIITDNGVSQMTVAPIAGTFNGLDNLIGNTSGATATITAAPPTFITDQFVLKKNGTSASETLQITAGFVYTFNEGISFKFTNDSGHTLNDYWTLQCINGNVINTYGTYAINGIDVIDISPSLGRVLVGGAAPNSNSDTNLIIGFGTAQNLSYNSPRNVIICNDGFNFATNDVTRNIAIGYNIDSAYSSIQDSITIGAGAVAFPSTFVAGSEDAPINTVYFGQGVEKLGGASGYSISGTNSYSIGSSGGYLNIKGGVGNGDGGNAYISGGQSLGANDGNTILAYDVLGATPRGKVAIGFDAPTAMFHLPAGGTSAGDAPMKMSNGGMIMAIPEVGAVEYNDLDYYFTNNVSGSPIRFAIGGVLFDHTADAGNVVATGETDLYADNLPAGVLEAQGKKILAQYAGIFTACVADTRQIRVYFDGTEIYNTGVLGFGSDTDWNINVTIITESLGGAGADVVKCAVTACEVTGGIPYTKYTRITALTLSNSLVLKITGEAAGVGAADDDVVAKLGYVEVKGVGDY